MKSFKTSFGHFSADGTEYVITDKETPRPWVNVIGNEDYGFVVSQTGSGYSWRTHAQLNRITRWEQDLIRDDWGKYIYLRDERGNLWSAGWKPVCAEPDTYECRHGIGSTTIASSNHGIASELTVFVHPDQPLEFWRLTLRNTTRRPRLLDVTTYFEWGLGQAPDWHREFHRSFIKTSYDPGSFAIMATKRLWEAPSQRGHWNTEWPYVAFHSASVKPSSFDTDKESFLGMYGSLREPRAVTEGKLRRKTGDGLDPIGSLQVKIRLKPRETATVVFTLGAAGSPEEARACAISCRSLANVDTLLAEVRRQWDALLGTLDVHTPDDAMNLMTNTWLKYQAISGRMWARTAYYQTGGAFGFRDQLQDSLLWLLIDPVRTLRQLRLHARHQFRDGAVYHWWHPLSELGLRNLISDNLLWLPYVMHHYLRETADFGALEIAEPFVDDGTEASMYDHCIRAIDYALGRFSPRGLPLIGGGDWNDGLSAVGLDLKGESIWLGEFLHRILVDFGEIARRQNDTTRAENYTGRARALRHAINTHGWDGSWYYGATKDSGGRLGSRTNSEGSVWLNPQTWAIIGGVADPARAEAVMNVVEQQLEDEIGPLLLRPAYKTPDMEVGYLTRYAPGMRENGGVYTHGATWAIIAAAGLGRGETAFRIYSKLNPINRGKAAARYAAEPYVTPGNIEGPDSPFHGRGGWTWYTGSAAWLLRAGVESILGIRPEFEGLRVDPCIPRSWGGFTARRIFRGAIYMIAVENPSRVERGVRELWIDGVRNQGPVIPPFPAGTEHQIRVVMG